MRSVRSVKCRVFNTAIGCVGFIVIGFLAACGGGGGGGPDPTPTFTTIPSPTSTHTFTWTSAPTPTPSPSPPLSVTATRITTPAVTFTATLTSTPTDTATPQPTLAPTSTPLTGPIVTAFGVADATGTINVRVGPDDQGRSIFARQPGAGFILFVEGRLGPSRLPVGTDVFDSKAGDPMRQPDLQIESSKDLGIPTQAVCDNAFPALGGVPAVDPPDFSAVQSISDALNDLGCRFKVFSDPDFACTQDASGNLMFDSSSSTVQFCTLVSQALTFPSGDTVLTARLRDTAGNAGPPVQIVVRITGG